MNTTLRILPFGSLAATLALALAGCKGADGADGPPGAPLTQDVGDAGTSSRSRPECAAKKPGGTPQTGGGIGSEIAPAPASIGADVPATYFGPAPSSVNPNLVGPYTELKSGSLDLDKGTITLPLYKGQVASTGKTIYYILTDTSDKGIADGLGLNYSAKLKFGNAGPSTGVNGTNPAGTLPARQAHTRADGTLLFDKGTVDFGPVRSVTPGTAPGYFPPTALQPGSVGDSDYTPIIFVTDQAVTYNAPVVAYDATDADLDFCKGTPDHSKVHDKVAAICPKDGTVTLRLTTGFSFGKPVVYLSTDASDGLPAALEEATFAPALQNTRVGGDDGAFSAVERIFSFVNGPANLDGKGVNPQRQGLSSALRGEGSPLNVLGGIPHVATDYSPLWDFNLGEWTAAAIARGYRSRLNEEFQILGFVQRGFVTGPGGAKWGSTGIIVNCPIVHRFL